jgi:hypothetical protein
MEFLKASLGQMTAIRLIRGLDFRDSKIFSECGIPRVNRGRIPCPQLVVSHLRISENLIPFLWRALLTNASQHT